MSCVLSIKGICFMLPAYIIKIVFYRTVFAIIPTQNITQQMKMQARKIFHSYTNKFEGESALVNKPFEVTTI